MGKNPPPVWPFICYSLKIKYFPFLKSWLATILYKKKTIKRAKTWKYKRKAKKEVEKDRNRFANNQVKILACAHAWKTKKLFNYAISRKICLCLMQNSFLAILLAILISRKPVQRRGIGEKCDFFAPRRPSPKVKQSYHFVSNWPFSS